MGDFAPLKPWKSFEEQLDLLSKRGLIIDDEKMAIHYLSTLGYQRLHEYFYPFQLASNATHPEQIDNFYPETSFSDVANIYFFDASLRVIIALEALEFIEISVRVNIAYILGKNNPSAHLESKFFDQHMKEKHQNWCLRYQSKLEDRKKSHPEFVTEQIDKYGNLPIWAACEIWDFGEMSRLYSYMKYKDKKKIYSKYEFVYVLDSLLRSLNFIRNTCAHYSRIWNRSIIGYTDKRLIPREIINYQLALNKPFLYFCILGYWMKNLKINNSATWVERYVALLNSFPEPKNKIISIREHGVPETFEVSTLIDLF